jgi:hypothetical protein
MHYRCRSSFRQRKDYFDRGIRVCARWKSFSNFLADMGERPTGNYSIDRINNDLGYYPENCKWSDKVEQALRRRIDRFGRL